MMIPNRKTQGPNKKLNKRAVESMNNSGWELQPNNLNGQFHSNCLVASDQNRQTKSQTRAAKSTNNSRWEVQPNNLKESLPADEKV
jgi:hypothetical protein